MSKMHFVSCHNRPERSFFWKGRQLPMCARCTGIQLGYLTMPIFLMGWLSMPLWLMIVMIVPTYLDGWIQWKWNIESNNIRRFVTGIAAGIGTMALTAVIGKGIGNAILFLINT